MGNDWPSSARYYDLILGKEKFAKSARFIVKVLKRHKIKSVLEIGCGTGMYLLPLQKHFNIEGLDHSKEMLAKVQGKIKLHHKDMTNFKLKKFDAILCLNSTLILLPNFKQIKKTLKNCYGHLNDDGIFILDLPNHTKKIKESDYTQEHDTYKIPRGRFDVIFRDYKKGNKWISEWHGFLKKGKQYSTLTERYEEFIYSPKELEAGLKKIGFKIIHKYGSRTGGPFNKHSYRRMYVCKKG